MLLNAAIATPYAAMRHTLMMIRDACYCRFIRRLRATLPALPLLMLMPLL